MNLASAQGVLDAYLSADIPAFLWGAPGIGKSDLVRQVSKARGLPLIDLRAILLDPVDLRGLPTVNGKLASWAEPAFLPRVDRDGPAGLLFLDELNAAPASVQAACFGLVLDRRLGEYRLPSDWRIVAAGNRQSDRAAAGRMPTALANRFAHIDCDADVVAWCIWAIEAGIAPVIIAFVRFRPALLHAMPDSDARAFMTPRSIAQVSKIIGLSDAIRPAAVAGLIGEGAAAEFEGFLRLWRSLPPIADLIANPDRAPVPREPGTLYAVASALARKSDRGNFGNVQRYLSRLPKEFGIMATLDAIRREPGLKETGAFVAWATSNQGVTL